MSNAPTVSADALQEQLRLCFEQLCRDVAAAVNQAPAGQIINASEEKVRDLLADFRLATYQLAVQLRTDAAQAAFPPPKHPLTQKPLQNKGPDVLRPKNWARGRVGIT
jgi:hypothetical protein